MQTVTLNNGLTIPAIGFGVFKIPDGQPVIDALRAAIDAGYRRIDTASAYNNEKGVGEFVRTCGLPREELVVTTKLNNPDHGYDRALEAFDESLERLGLDYVDIYLIHWPGTRAYVETWKALEKIHADGRAKAIGVSNFHDYHLEKLFSETEIVPATNQIECHPCLTQVELRAFCRKHGIWPEAWSPIMRGRLSDNPVLTEIAAAHGKTVAQVILRWHVQNGVLAIPKTVTPSRMKENIDIFDFELSSDEMAEVEGLNENKRTGPNPDEVDF